MTAPFTENSAIANLIQAVKATEHADARQRLGSTSVAPEENLLNLKGQLRSKIQARVINGIEQQLRARAYSAASIEGAVLRAIAPALSESLGDALAEVVLDMLKEWG